MSTLAKVVGANCKRIRIELGMTQDELSRQARSIGLHWNASKVSDFESGRSAPTFATVLAVSLLLRSTLSDLTQFEHPVRINDVLVWQDGSVVDPRPAHSSVLERSGLTEDRLARQLGIERALLADVSDRLWHSTFTEERDRRAGPDSNPQKRGRISRDMRNEVTGELA